MWFRRKSRPSHREPVDPSDDSWITVPFRMAEAARVSIYTIAMQQDIPIPIRNWIGHWLAAYNSHLIFYMRENYGPDVFPLLDRITAEVMPEGTESTPPPPPGADDSWEKWEGQFKEEGK